MKETIETNEDSIIELLNFVTTLRETIDDATFKDNAEFGSSDEIKAYLKKYLNEEDSLLAQTMKLIEKV